MAPQAMVMNTNGKSGPAMIGPPPPMILREGRRLERRVRDDDANASSRIVPIFM